MKKFQFFIIIILAIATQANSQATSIQTSNNFKKLNWLVGTWNRTNAKPGRSGIEQWKLTSVYELRGFGINLKGSDTTFIEKLRIIIKDDFIAYVADVPGNQKLVYFRLTEITENSFVCENAEHDFPKKISYQLEGNKLNAKISGGGKMIDYLFEKR